METDVNQSDKKFKWNEDQISPTEIDLTFSQKRTINRKTAQIASDSDNHAFYRSLQNVPLKENISKLRSLRKCTCSTSLHNRLDALICVLEDLSCKSSHNNSAVGIMNFQVALDIYADFINAPFHIRRDDLSSRLKDDLLDPEHGIRCIIYQCKRTGKKYIILESDDINILGILQKIALDDEDSRSLGANIIDNIDYGYINTALKTLDTEHDRGVAKCILAKFLGRGDMLAIGIKPDKAVKNLEKSRHIFQEISNAKLAAEDMIELRLKGKVEKYEENLQEINKVIESKSLTAMREGDFLARKEIVEDQLNSVNKLLHPETAYDRQRHKNCVKRLADKLIQENRIKGRALGNGAKPILDSEDEQFIANAIESKSSAHGRRHDTVLYMHHRVKLEDLLSIANYNLLKRGKRLLRSAKTVHLRARPRKINTIEGRRHKGHWLFCTKKPPKTEDHETELTHHQRAHVKLNRMDMFCSDSPLKSFSLDISFDDKAYIRPGTDVGLRDTKAGRILTLTAESKQRKLPQHDFATPEVFQTPSSFRMMTWKTETIQGKESLVKDCDQSCVVVRPKYYIGSTGCVWGSDLLRLRYEEPDIFEIQDGAEVSAEKRKMCAIVRDAAFYFIDSTSVDDLNSLLTGKIEFKQYETERVKHLISRIELLKDCTENIPEITTKLEEIRGLCGQVIQLIRDDDMKKCCENICALKDTCTEVVLIIDSMKLPQMKFIISEYTDGGPGVGVTNTAVRFRFAEMCSIQNSIRRVRIHRASGDSAQNEAERTNSAIGDALVDGATIRWEYFKPFDGLSPQEVDAMSSSDLEKHKAAVMEKNAWAVSEEVNMRINDAKGPQGFIYAYVTEHKDEQFFWNGVYIKKYHESSKATKAEVPGHGYFKKIYDFIDQHIEVGELYMEYRKYKCEHSSVKQCDFCQESPVCDVVGSQMIHPVPRPYPDYDRLPAFHYLEHNRTPTDAREIDDFQPRTNLKKAFARGELKSANQIEEFSKKYIISEDLVKKYVSHLETLQAGKEKRSLALHDKKKEETSKTYEDYNWVELFENNAIDKLTVSVLDKYIKHHNLGSLLCKHEKVRAVKQSIAMSLVSEVGEQSDDEDLILDKYSDDSETESISESQEESSSSESDSTLSTNFQTKSRRVKLPARYQDYVTY